MIDRFGFCSFPLLCVGLLLALATALAEDAPKVPRFSLDYLDRSVSPAVDFYRFADGNWLKNNPVPPDKSRWGGFNELQERNWRLIRSILESCATNSDAPRKSPTREVGDFFASAMNTNRLEQLAFRPIAADLERIARLRSGNDVVRLLADFHQRGIGAFFNPRVEPDPKDSSIYAFRIAQGGLGLPDRDYYLKDTFTKQREAYHAHIATMLKMLGESAGEATAHATTILDLETALAQASKPRADLRDPVANYHKFTVAELEQLTPALPWKPYLSSSRLDKARHLVVGQPEFLQAEEKLVKERPLTDWQVYLRWHLLRSAAPFLHHAAENENFAFYQTVLSGTPQPEPRWQRAAQFESRRQFARVGKPVDRAEWDMTPQTVNAYFNPSLNEIVFPAGILQPPFFDMPMDDAVNYGAIGVVIGHEITHGYDDEGRKYDADGNLNEWWTDEDAKKFEARAQKVIDQYGSYEALPGFKVNGKLTLGENIADLGGASIAFDALQRALAQEPSKRKAIGGFTPEQRFFLSLTQIWRTNWREDELKRRLTVDPHSPGQFRAIGPHVNLEQFYQAFDIKPGDPMYRPAEQRAKIW